MMSLTPAECRVAELLDNGLTYQAIANELVVSYHTIKKHVQNIYLKCGVNSRYELHKWMEFASFICACIKFLLFFVTDL